MNRETDEIISYIEDLVESASNTPEIPTKGPIEIDNLASAIFFSRRGRKFYGSYQLAVLLNRFPDSKARLVRQPYTKVSIKNFTPEAGMPHGFIPWKLLKRV